MGCAVLPHLRQMVEIVEHGLVDEQQKVSACVRARGARTVLGVFVSAGTYIHRDVRVPRVLVFWFEDYNRGPSIGDQNRR